MKKITEKNFDKNVDFLGHLYKEYFRLYEEKEQYKKEKAGYEKEKARWVKSGGLEILEKLDRLEGQMKEQDLEYLKLMGEKNKEIRDLKMELAELKGETFYVKSNRVTINDEDDWYNDDEYLKRKEEEVK